MSPSTLISPAAGSTAAIVGTPPTAQRSAGDGSAAPESFARALNQASSPPPAAPLPPASARDEERSDAAAAGTATARDGTAQQTEHAAAARAATQRRAAAQADTAKNEKSRTAGPTTGLSGVEDERGTPAVQARDTPACELTGDAVGATPGADQLPAAPGAGTAAAADRSAGKVSSPIAGAAGAAGIAAARAGGRATGDASSAAPGATARRGDTGADAPTAANEREIVSRHSPAAGAAATAVAPTAPAANAANAAIATWPAAATPLSATAHGAPAPTLAEARLQASPGSAEFAPALGAQLNVFLRDGIQHARLQLHPAELGPLTVQIQIDGATAQVRMAAEHPLTRQALEQAIPTLASTLRESGLTLTGGGVFEQPAQTQSQTQSQSQHDGRAPAGARGAGTRDGRDTAAQADAAPLRTLAARRGVVDLVA